MKHLFLQATSNGNFKFLDLIFELGKQFASAIPRFFGAFLVLILGWMLAKFVSKLIKKLLTSSGIDKLADKLNEIDFIERSNFKITFSTLLAKVVYYIMLLIFLIAATDLLGMPAVSSLVTDIINYVPNLLSAGIVLIIGILFADFIKNIVQTACQSLGIPSSKLIASFIFYFIFLAVVMSALGQAKINTDFIRSNLTVIIGGGVLAFALGYGFASRDMMANFIASFYSKNKVNIGDVIRIEGMEGEIVDMDNSSLTLKASDRLIIVPLSKLTSENVEIMARRSTMEE
ncbi:MAG: mechanosensitive ion channel [Saprospiraceae bacterium]|nr:mechanosensitive ion channel [Saprospiraceae bacterium]